MRHTFQFGPWLIHWWVGVFHNPRYSIYSFGLWAYWTKDLRGEFRGGWFGNWERLV
jgi:hypothetical protein